MDLLLDKFAKLGVDNAPGQEALQKARENVIDLIICDIKMPILSGVELAEIIQRELPEISFIIWGSRTHCS